MVNTRDPIDELNITVIQHVEDLMEVRGNFEIWKTDFGAIFCSKIDLRAWKCSKIGENSQFFI